MPTARDSAFPPPWWTRPASRTVALALFVAMLAGQERTLLAGLVKEGLPALTDSLALPLLFAGLALLLSEPWRWGLLALLGALFSCILTFDKGSLAYFMQPVNLSMSTALPQLWHVRDSTQTLVSGLDWLYTGSFLLFGLYGLLLQRAGTPATRRRRGLERLAGLALVAVAAWPLSGAWAEQAMPRSALELKHPAIRYVRDHGFGLYHVWDIVETRRQAARRGRLAPDQERLVAAVMAERKALNDTPGPLYGIAAGRNVILVQLEALQQFALGFETPAGPVTPTLDRLAREGLVWDHCMDMTMLGRTSDAEFVALTALLPHQRKMVALTFMDNTWVTLPRTLRDAGYATLSMHAYERTFWNRAIAHPAYGIDDSTFAAGFQPGRPLAMGLSDEDFFRQAAERLAAATRPFFALLISLSSHHPFSIVPEELDDWDTGLPDGMAANYLKAVHYTDGAVQVLLDALADRGLLQDSMLVIYGDHTAGLDGPANGDVLTHLGRDPSSIEERRVPLIIAIPGEEQALSRHRDRFRATVGGMHDIAPTVLHLLGRPSPAGFYGTHLFVPPGDRALMPLSASGGYVLDGRIHAGGDAALDDPERARQAWAHLKLGELIIEHDAQTTRPRATDEPLEALLATALMGLAPESPPPWTVRTHQTRPLPVSGRVVAAIPPASSGFELRLELRNTAAEPRTWSLDGYDSSGRRVLHRGGSVAAGEMHVEGLRPDAADADGDVAWARLETAPDVSAASRVHHALGTIEQPLLDTLAGRTEITGSTPGIRAVAVVAVNPTDTRATVRIGAKVGDRGITDATLTLPPFGHAAQAVPVPVTDEDISIVVGGDAVAVHWIRWDGDRVPYR